MYSSLKLCRTDVAGVFCCRQWACLRCVWSPLFIVTLIDQYVGYRSCDHSIVRMVITWRCFTHEPCSVWIMRIWTCEPFHWSILIYYLYPYIYVAAVNTSPRRTQIAVGMVGLVPKAREVLVYKRLFSSQLSVIAINAGESLLLPQKIGIAYGVFRILSRWVLIFTVHTHTTTKPRCKACLVSKSVYILFLCMEPNLITADPSQLSRYLFRRRRNP